MQTPWRVVPLLLAPLAGAAGLAALSRLGADSVLAHLLLAIATVALGFAVGAYSERRVSLRATAETSGLEQQIERLQQALAAASQVSSQLQSETAQALLDSEALYHSLVDHLPLSVLRKDKSGAYTFVNRRYLEFSGKPSHEVIGKTDFDLFPHELATRYRKGDEQVLASGAMFEDIEAYRKLDGDKRYIQVLKMPVRDASQSIIGTQVMFWDVTDRKRAEEAVERAARELEARNAALQESEQSLQRQTGILKSVLNSIADGVVVADEAGRFVVWNPAADRIIGLGPMDKPTADWPETYGLYELDGATPFPPDQVPLTRAIKGETVAGIEMVVRNKSQSQGVILSINGTPLLDPDGQVKGGVVVFRDVTRKKAAEAEIRSKNQDLETLLYVISHDLREPLRAIENFSRIVCDRYAGQLDAKGRDFLARVVNGATRLDRLLEDVLQLSRVERTTQVEQAVESQEIVDEVLRRLDPQIRETQAVVTVSPGLPQIRADRRWATQAVQNLVSNALKYTVEGTIPNVEIGGYTGPEGVGLIVRDRGLGVPADCAERIFLLFQRAVSRKIEGTGAGLAIVKRVAERHGGRAWVRPRDGGGSEFIITFGSTCAV